MLNHLIFPDIVVIMFTSTVTDTKIYEKILRTYYEKIVPFIKL